MGQYGKICSVRIASFVEGKTFRSAQLQSFAIGEFSLAKSCIVIGYIRSYALINKSY
jgi:hypothetical protein